MEDELRMKQKTPLWKTIVIGISPVIIIACIIVWIYSFNEVMIYMALISQDMFNAHKSGLWIIPMVGSMFMFRLYLPYSVEFIKMFIPISTQR